MSGKSYPPFDLTSAISGVEWPAVPEANASVLFALLFQLEQSQWWNEEQIRAHQWKQLRRSLDHAYRTVPFYHERFDSAGLKVADLEDPDAWRRLPVLVRRELQAGGEALVSTAIPRDHGRTSVRVTGGSTGEPVRVLGTAITGFAWRVFTLRDHLWHHRDFRGKLAVVRFMEQEAARPPAGALTNNWGTSTRNIATGPCAILTIHSTTQEQAEWLARHDPEYFLSYPSAIVALARYCEKHAIKLPKLREVRTFGEVVEPQVREICRDVWGVRVVDAYSSEEFGYLALQCPEHEHYHVQSENVLLEVLDDQGQPCQPGDVGRVFVTSLNNFAMPLLRYDIGDYAEVGEPCPCGRGLTVLKRVLGRQRNMFTLPTGETRWPMIDARDIAAVFNEVPPITKFQLVQKSLDELEARLVVVRPLTSDEETTLASYVQQGLGYAFRLHFNYVDDIPRSPRGKFEEFRSEVPPS